MKTKLQSLEFTIHHFSLIGVFALMIIGLTVMKDPILLQNITSLKFLKASSGENTQTVVQVPSVKPVSYENIETIVQEKNDMLSLLDPSFGEGSVLGVSTETQKSVNDILSAENLEKIPVNIVSANEESITAYFSKINLIEAYHGQTIILSAISTKDAAAAEKTLPLLNSLIGELKSISVPQPFTHYHRLKLMQNAVLLNMASAITIEISTKDQAAAGVLFFEITNALESERAELIKMYSYAL